MTIFKRRYNSLSNKLLRVACQPLTILNILNHLISDLFLIPFPQPSWPKEEYVPHPTVRLALNFFENLGSPEFHFRHKTFFHTKLRHSTTLNPFHTFTYNSCILEMTRKMSRNRWEIQKGWFQGEKSLASGFAALKEFQAYANLTSELIGLKVGS